jgi:integrase
MPVNEASAARPGRRIVRRTASRGASVSVSLAPDAPPLLSQLPPQAPETAPDNQDTLTRALLLRCANGWALDLRAENKSPSYQEGGKFITSRLLWWLDRDGHASCGPDQIKGFMIYLQHAHEGPEGRWGEAGETRATHAEKAARTRGYQPVSVRYAPISDCTIKDYWVTLRAFFNWVVAQGILEKSPLARMKAPVHRPDQMQPYTNDQVTAIIEAAAKSNFARRNTAIVAFLLDTGVRADELCGLRWAEVDIVRQCATVLGKGRKRRLVSWSKQTQKALVRYSQETGTMEDKDAPVFRAEGGPTAGEPLTVGGLRKIIKGICAAAGVTSEDSSSQRICTHTFRNTAAVNFLRAGGDQMTLMNLLGHNSLEMTKRYVSFCSADIEAQMRAHSPYEFLTKKR